MCRLVHGAEAPRARPNPAVHCKSVQRCELASLAKLRHAHKFAVPFVVQWCPRGAPTGSLFQAALLAGKVKQTVGLVTATVEEGSHADLASHMLEKSTRFAKGGLRAQAIVD